MKLRIAELCREAEITQAELAEKIGITRVGLSKAINGNPTLDTLERIAEGLGVSVVELFEVKKEIQDANVCPKCGSRLKITIEEY